MAEVERRNLSTRPVLGDIIEATWNDHFQFEGNKPPTKPVRVKSWGKLVDESPEGVAVAQTEVQEFEPDFPVPSIHVGQFIVRSSMTELKKANGHHS